MSVHLHDDDGDGPLDIHYKRRINVGSHKENILLLHGDEPGGSSKARALQRHDAEPRGK